MRRTGNPPGGRRHDHRALEPFPGLEPPIGLVPARILALDADRDGDVDLVSPAWVENAGGALGAVLLILNRGLGAFEPAARVGDVVGFADAAAADLDGDGWVDLALSQFFFSGPRLQPPPPGVSVLGGGAEGFSQPRSYLLPDHGAAGGVGPALVQLERLAGLEMYGTCSA
jgi:hypothetical protein